MNIAPLGILFGKIGISKGITGIFSDESGFGIEIEWVSTP